MHGINKKTFIGLISSTVNASSHTKCVSLSNQKCETQPTLINLHPNEYNQEFHYNPFAIKLDRCVGNSNTLNDLSNKVCVQIKPNLRLKSKRVQHDYRNKSIKNINQAYIMRL